VELCSFIAIKQKGVVVHRLNLDELASLWRQLCMKLRPRMKLRAYKKADINYVAGISGEKIDKRKKELHREEKRRET
jgi:hypothetical protein